MINNWKNESLNSYTIEELIEVFDLSKAAIRNKLIDCGILVPHTNNDLSFTYSTKRYITLKGIDIFLKYLKESPIPSRHKLCNDLQLNDFYSEKGKKLQNVIPDNKDLDIQVNSLDNLKKKNSVKRYRVIKKSKCPLDYEKRMNEIIEELNEIKSLITNGQKQKKSLFGIW